MVEGKDKNIIAEVQFLFTEMFDYKKIAHSLYAIERKGEFVDNMTKILDIKLDLTKQMFIHAARDNIKGLTDLMVTHDFDNEDLMMTNQRNQSILTPICTVNAKKTLSYLVKQIDDEVIKDRLVFPDMDGYYPLQLAVSKNHFDGVLLSVMKGDKLGLADYENPSKVHISSYCWSKNCAKSALLILKNITSKERIKKLIDKEYTLYNLMGVGDADLLRYVWDQLKSNPKAKEKWLAKGDAREDGKWSNLHDACCLGKDKGGSVECVKELLSFYGEEKEQEQLWQKQDRRLQTPLFHAATNAMYNILEWRLSAMSEDKKAEFFTSQNMMAREPIELLLDNRYGGKNDLKALKIMVSHLTSSYEKKFSEIFLFAAQKELSIWHVISQFLCSTYI